MIFEDTAHPNLSNSNTGFYIWTEHFWGLNETKQVMDCV